MDEEPRTQDVSAIDNPDVMHETSDISVRAVIGFAAALVVAAIVIHFLVWLLFDLYGGMNAAAYPREYPMAQSGQLRLPPAPRLQDKPREDLKVLRQQEDDLLNGYTWIDRQTGAVRIPIDQAMKRVLERGLPVRANPPAEEPGPPTASSSGRVADR